MSTRRHRLVGGLVTALTALTLAGAPALANAAPRQAPTTNPSSGPGLSQLNACITRNRRLDLAVLMDESGSLQNTDPNNQRVTALKSLLSGLVNQAPATKAPLVTVELDGFAKTFDHLHPFQPLTAATLPTLLASAQQFAAKNTGGATDFRVGLDQVHASLARQAAAEARPTCQAIVFFTDGQYAVSGAHGDQAAQRVLCENGQVVDALRRDRVALIAVGLGKDPATLLPKLVGAGGCGDVPASAGLFLPASNVAALLAAFDLTTGILNGGNPGKTTYGRTRQFPLGADLSRLELLLEPPATPAAVTIVAPNGTSVTLSATQRDATQAGIHWHVGNAAPGYLRVDGTVTGATQDHVGTWTLRYDSAASANAATDIVLFPDLRAALDTGQVAHLGTSGTLGFSTQRATGQAPDPAEQRQPHRLTVTLTDPTTGATVSAGRANQAGSTFNLNFTPPRAETATSLDVLLRLDSLAPDGSTLTSVTTGSVLQVRPPITFPSVQPSRLNFGTIRRGHTGTVTLTVIGGEQSGCALIGALTTTRVPGGVHSVTSTSTQTQCSAVTKGQRRTVTVTVDPHGSGTGQVAGTLPITLRDAAGHSLRVAVPVSGYLLVPINQTKRWVLFALLLALGVLIPLLVMYLIAYLGGRLRPAGAIRYLNIPVTVTENGITAPKPLTAPQWSTDPRLLPDDAANSAQIAVPDGPTIKRHLPRSPFGAPTAIATTPNTDVVGSAGKTRPDAGDYGGVVPTQVDAAWLFEASGETHAANGEPALQGTLTVLVSDNPGTGDPLATALASAQQRLPDEAAGLLAEREQRQAQRAERDGSADTDAAGAGADGSAGPEPSPPDDRFTSDPFEDPS